MLAVAEINILELKRGHQLLQQNVKFSWKQGQHWCVTGNTASGKTTLLQLIAGQLYLPTAEIHFPSLSEFCAAQQPRKYLSDYIVFVPQEVRIPTVYIEDLYYQRRFQAAEQADIPSTREVLLRMANGNTSNVEHAATTMQLSAMLDQPFVQLSNGQTRRLMIALALVKQPKILVLDNPYAGLDINARQELNEILKVVAHTGVHIIMAAHEHEIMGVDFITNIFRLNDKAVLDRNQLSKFRIENAFADNTLSSIPVVKMQDVVVKYGAKTVLKNLNWEVKTGEHWVIKGKNGSGKSTLLSLLFADHPQAYSNSIFWKGKKRGTGESIWDVKKDIGYFSPELLRFFDSNNNCEAVIGSGWNDIIGQIRAMTPEQKKEIAQMAHFFGIQTLLERSFQTLSAGEQRIVLLVRAFIKQPLVLILDEPLQGLDLSWRTFLKHQIQQIAQNKTLLYVTHDEEEIPDGEWRCLELV